MSVGQPAIWKGPTAHERPWPRRISRPAQYVLYSAFGTLVALVVSLLFVLFGIGMSRQDPDVAIITASASLIAILIGFVVTRRLLSYPLLRTYRYFAVTFVSTFILVAIGLKFLRIDFSSPQHFLAMVVIVALVESFFYINRHATPLHMAIVPGVTSLPALPRGAFRSVAFTRLAKVPSGNLNFSGAIADFGADLAPEWEHFLANAALQGIPVYHVKHFGETFTGRVAVDHLRENTFGAVVPALIYPQFKRALDFLSALLAFPVVAVIIGICGMLIKLETPGPIFFRHTRTGLGGRPFTIVKLRTMIAGHNGSDYTLPDDKRITRVGRVLRDYRLDELPQIINILRGEMSWIGPRPEAVALAEWYEREVPFYVYRHIVRPGLSGWAQVHQGNVAAVDAARLKLEYDFFYIKHYSFWLDVVIVVKTLRTIFTRFGSR